ncbi:hypothetical protein GCM10010306_015230 [Streptomyces umbrinus]|nr:hypothetical protein GCM10010306_015230 [Streptomyces umbrinus]
MGFPTGWWLAPSVGSRQRILAPAAPTHSRPSGAPPPNPRSSNAGEAKYFAARADTISPSGV